MKKRYFLILAALAAIVCTACSLSNVQTPAVEPAYDLYFRVADLSQAAGKDAIAAQPSEILLNSEEEADLLAETLVRALLKGPEDLQLCTPFPEGTELRSVRIFGGHAVVDLSAVYANLSGIELAMADYCITLTLTQIPEVRSVQTTVNGGLLAYRSSQNFTARDVLISSGEDVVATVEVMLYFCDVDSFLVGEARELKLYEGDTLAESLIAELMKGSENPELFSVFPEGFYVQSVWVKDGRCYVNLASSMLQSLPQEISMFLPVQALRSSLLSLENVWSIQLLVDGEPTDSLEPYRTPPEVVAE